MRKKDFLPFEEAREYARGLGLKGMREWRKWLTSGERPYNIPSAPDRFYKDKGWISWMDWLGKENFLSFKEARDYARGLGLKGMREWHHWARSGERPYNIPSAPVRSYKDQGWISWIDWLGSEDKRGSPSKDFLPFEEAREYARGLGLKSVTEWHHWARSIKRPNNIPSNPNLFYKDKGWISWMDWLGNEDKRGACSKDFLSFGEARDYVRGLGLKSAIEWREWTKSGERPYNIPSAPDRFYKDKGWISFGDWLGSEDKRGSSSKDFLSFEEARKYVRGLGLRLCYEWRKWLTSEERPYNIPSNPNIVYKDQGWISFGDWLGTQNKRGACSKDFLSFEEAREYARNLGLKSVTEWKRWARSGERPYNIPSNANVIYKNKGWINWMDWLGKENFLSFKEAREYVRALGLSSLSEWIKWLESEDRPDNIPAAPNSVYKDQGWIGWKDWLGKEDLNK